MNLFRFAAATTFATFVLLIVGGTVNPAGASLACPDWPTCFGSFFPAMKNGVQFEHTHRLVASLVGLLTVILGVWIWVAKPPKPGVRGLALLAIFMVLLQGALGGITVLLRLPLFVSAGHLALSMVFFATLIYLTIRLWPGERSAPSSAPRPKRGLVGVALAVVYGQILLGAFVRHTGAGRVCGVDWMLCQGQAWPHLGAAQTHMIHRLMGYITFTLVIAASIYAAKQAKVHGRGLARLAAIAAPVIATMQVLLGILTVASGIGIVEAAAHLGGGALLLCGVWTTFLALGPRTLHAADVTAAKPSRVERAASSAA